MKFSSFLCGFFTSSSIFSATSRIPPCTPFSTCAHAGMHMTTGSTRGQLDAAFARIIQSDAPLWAIISRKASWAVLEQRAHK